MAGDVKKKWSWNASISNTEALEITDVRRLGCQENNAKTLFNRFQSLGEILTVPLLN